MSNITPLIRNTLSLLEGNLNSSFASQLSEILLDKNLNISGLWKPLIDIMESDSFVFIYVCVPGVNYDSIDIDFMNNIVVIKGERKYPNENIDENIVTIKQEIIYGPFERKVKIPIVVSKSESVNITMEDGLIVIKIDKSIESSNRFSMRPSRKSYHNNN